MILLRKHQKRLVDQVMDNVQMSVVELMDKQTRIVREQDRMPTMVIAPWCSNSGKTGVIEYLAAKLAFDGFRTLVFVSNDDHMKQRYNTVKGALHSAWCLKRAEDAYNFVTTDHGGITYFVSNETNSSIITDMQPKLHVVLVEEGDYVNPSLGLEKVLNEVPTALVIGTRRGPNSGLLSILISKQDPRDGVTINRVENDDLLAEGYDRSIHDTLADISQNREETLRAARSLSNQDVGANNNESGILHDTPSRSANKIDDGDITSTEEV